jgi:hypothetical protein
MPAIVVRSLMNRLLCVLVVASLLLAACGPEAWERDPAIQAAKRECKQVAEGDSYTCIERRAVETLNPDVCRLAGIWIDDMCLQAVYEAAGDPAICDELYLEVCGLSAVLITRKPPPSCCAITTRFSVLPRKCPLAGRPASIPSL